MCGHVHATTTPDIPVGGLHPVGRIESTSCDISSSVCVVLIGLLEEDSSLYNAHLQYVWRMIRLMSIVKWGRGDICTPGMGACIS